jgi:hypothetical protein
MNEAVPTTCPICNLNVVNRETAFLENGDLHVNCSRCSPYHITNSAVAHLATTGAEDHFQLSAYLRQNGKKNIRTTRVTRSNIRKYMTKARIPDGILETIDQILIELPSMRRATGNRISVISHIDYPLFGLTKSSEVDYLVDIMQEGGYIEREASGRPILITLQGYRRIDELRRSASQSDRAFLAMWFPDRTDEPEWYQRLTHVFEAKINRSLDLCGFKGPYRVDRDPHNEKGDDRIEASIRRSSLVVADFTGLRGGVYYEVGLARGLGIPVVWTCHKEYIDKLHFDTRQFNHICWEEETDIGRELIARIGAEYPDRLPDLPDDYVF